MASFKEHCEDCIREFGKPYEEVHIWLDELFKTLGPKHRDARHHEGGVSVVAKKWGPEGARAAEVHIKKDCGGVVPTKEQAQMWSLFGPDIVNVHGNTFLTDETNIIQYAPDLGTDDAYIITPEGKMNVKTGEIIDEKKEEN